jgi:hypothetical protein
MEYISARQAAEKWNISGRRVRVMCRDGKIPGTVMDGRSYKIPAGAGKPADGRLKKARPPVRWIKWDNDVVGTIDGANTVTFISPEHNEVVALYTRGTGTWSPEQFAAFLSVGGPNRSTRSMTTGAACFMRTPRR